MSSSRALVLTAVLSISTVASRLAFAQEVTPPPNPPTAPVAPANDDGFSAGYGGEAFYLKAPKERFVLFPGIRLQVDGYGYAGKGVKDFQRSNGTGLKANLTPRRTRLELGGRVLSRFYFFFGGEFGGTSLGTAGNVPEQPQSTAAFADAFVGIDFDTLLNVQVGQFDVPFMMESYTSDKYLDFMERSLTVRVAGTYSDKDSGLMVRGETKNQLFNYAVALVGGDGKNRPSVDNKFDVLGRAFVLPLAGSTGSMSRMHFGASGRWGRRDPDYVYYDVRTMATPGGYAFWIPSYGKSTTETHIIPANQQMAFAAEAYLPFHDRVDLRAEGVFVKEAMREAFPNELYNTIRSGVLKGFAYYVQLSVWPYGRPRVNGEPGFEPTPKLRTTPPPEQPDGLQLAIRWEQLLLKYDSLANTTDPTVARGELDRDTRNIKVNAFQAVVNYWATKHVRLTAEYSLFMFPGIGPATNSRVGVASIPPGPVENQAAAPGSRANAFAFDAHVLHEISCRIAIAL